jgi:hypothetical protein
MDQITKWQEINLKEFNGILEIKFGKEIYENKDYYSFLTHLAQKQEYDINQMLKKQDTMLEGIVVSAINKYKSGLKDAYAPDISFDRFKNLRFSLTFDYEEEIHVGEDMYVTNIIFKKIK